MAERDQSPHRAVGAGAPAEPDAPVDGSDAPAEGPAGCHRAPPPGEVLQAVADFVDDLVDDLVDEVGDGGDGGGGGDAAGA